MISVNGVAIEQDAIGREMQHHPAGSRDEAERQAATALVVRELLLQRVRQRNIAGASEDDRIAHLIEQEVRIPEPTDEEIARYYRRNTLRFMTSPLYEAAHIFFPARKDDDPYLTPGQPEKSKGNTFQIWISAASPRADVAKSRRSSSHSGSCSSSE